VTSGTVESWGAGSEPTPLEFRFAASALGLSTWQLLGLDYAPEGSGEITMGAADDTQRPRILHLAAQLLARARGRDASAPAPDRASALQRLDPLNASPNVSMP
jgi:hypothetical protein